MRDKDSLVTFGMLWYTIGFAYSTLIVLRIIENSDEVSGILLLIFPALFLIPLIFIEKLAKKWVI